MTTQPTPPQHVHTPAENFCAPADHHLYAHVNVRATVVLTPDEETFEFWGDYEPNLTILDLECTQCDLSVAAGEPIPLSLRARINEALESASIQEPLD